MASGRSPRVLSVAILIAATIAAAWLLCPAFVPPAAPRTTEAGVPIAAAAGLAAPLLLAQPALADQPSPSGLPFVVVFFVLFAGLFIIPNAIFKGK
mmetsp:Transcript_2611/g.6096  ORF Transcript_2611/g.6096 Transcript_2611/m.6096 type:complete len:96 (-) Transcript_2611:152-439(-)|eukprot:CAMPEP_0170593256 /NCGR_PEP_ID=MMETSP0224-20130122/13351_1 /TAXON_ID=285029 /ORGANISM="Togula jolla, Strain CCCM 725" /LENGTH=95 /DNA_ID=CAMNT_0010917197 /DNA_START=56 /DNA_END=343 /DNA_ORIENTATION=+